MRVLAHMLSRSFLRAALAGAGMMAAVSSASAQSPPFVSEIAIFGGRYCPVGWLPADGRLLQIAENETLFNLIGTRYGGDGNYTFALPHLEPEQTMTNGSPLIACIALNGIFPSRY